MMLDNQRKEYRLVRIATYASVSVAILLMVIKAFAWLETGSVGILASLLDSAVDIVASLMILFAVRLAQEPADYEHRFGHGKAEPLAALAQSVFIAGSALYLMIHALQRLIDPVEVQDPQLGAWAMLLSLLMTTLLVMFQKYVVRKTNSTAIEADALHYFSDWIANLAVLLGLLLSVYGWIDSTLGLLIGAWIGWQALVLAKQSGNQLLDHELPEDIRNQIRDIVLAHEDVEGFNDLRTYRSGPTIFIQLDLELDDHLSLVDAHHITEEVTRSLVEAFENADVLIHQEPVSIRDDPEHHQWEMENREDFVSELESQAEEHTEEQSGTKT
ncbi:MAG: cation diffusion facilitator family transporter [Thiotrichales bacterium]|nr:cation diffusion facilitator family transporter [Thiotrichales bacterium]